jgi:hypothetical protein
MRQEVLAGVGSHWRRGSPRQLRQPVRARVTQGSQRPRAAAAAVSGGRFHPGAISAARSLREHNGANSGPNGNYTIYRRTCWLGRRENPSGWMSGGSAIPRPTRCCRISQAGFVVVASNATPGIGEEVSLGQRSSQASTGPSRKRARGQCLLRQTGHQQNRVDGLFMGSLATFTIATIRDSRPRSIRPGTWNPKRQGLCTHRQLFCSIPGDSVATS